MMSQPVLSHEQVDYSRRDSDIRQGARPPGGPQMGPVLCNPKKACRANEIRRI